MRLCKQNEAEQEYSYQMKLKSGQGNKGKRSVAGFLFIKDSLCNKDNDIIKFYVPNGITTKYIKQEQLKAQ